MDLLALASSSAGNFYLAGSDGRRLAIECGLPVGELREASGFGLSELDGCLISHHHADHARAAPDVLRAGVDCYASAGCWSALGIRSHHRAWTVRPGGRYEIGPWKVAPFDLRHDADGCLGFLVGAPDGDRLLYACDTAYVPQRFAAGLTHIAIECNYSAELLRASAADPAHKARVLRSHMSLERAIRFLLRNDLGAVREIHLLHLSDAHSDAGAFRDAVEAATGRPVRVALRTQEETK